MKLLVHRLNRTDQNVHIRRNEELFRKLGVEVQEVYNTDLLRGDLTGADAVYLNWFENIDGGRFFMPPLRYLRRRLQLWRIRRAGLGMIFCMHNRFPHNPRYPTLSRRLYYCLAKQADAIITFSEETKQALTEMFPKENFADKAEAIHPLHYIGAYPPGSSAKVSEAARQYRGKMLVCFLGKIAPYKNVELVLRAAKTLEGENIAFLICGEPVSAEYGAKLSAQAASLKNVTMDLRLIPDSEMCPILEAADLLIMPYDKKSAANSGTGRMAFSYGRTVITSDIASMNLIPEEWIYKYHYDTDAEHYDRMLEQLRRAYADWQRDPENLREKGRALLHLMETDYSEAAVMKQYQEIFRRVENRRPVRHRTAAPREQE